MLGYYRLWATFLFVIICVISSTNSQFRIIYSSGRNPNDGPRRFPFLRALVSQFISERSSPDYSKQDGDEYHIVPKSPKSADKKTQNTNFQSMKHIMDDINSQNVGSLSTRTRGYFLINILTRMLKSVNFTELSLQTRDGISSRASCLACNAVAGLFLSSLYSKEMMTVAVNTVCTSFRLQTPRVCSGIVESFKDDLDYIRKHTTLKRNEMCGVIFGMDCTRRATKNLNWTISIPEKQNSVKRRLDAGDDTVGYKSSDENYSSVVQLTDIHVDPYYIPGMSADCGEPLCCRAGDGAATDPIKAAGVWGDYRNCDTPIATLRHALKHISDTHSDALYWMWTGDIAPHDVWNVTRREVLSQIRLVTNLMKQYSRGLPVYPVIGNHEGVPVNSFPPPEVKGDHSISWLYDALADEWSYWLPKEAIKTLRFGGYYTVKPRPGFRIVCINTNYCARLNPWSLFNPIDPANQLQWLTDELFKAETDGDKVHIIGHIPPDNRECTQAWLYNFLLIIDRFQDIVLAQYYGHTHRDEFRLLYSPYYPEVPIGLAYIGPSITPFTENNPAYRLYYMDSEGYLADHETFYFNLTDANRGKSSPKWKHEYKAVDRFNMTTMSPYGWHELLNKLETDDSMFQSYYKLYYRNSDVKKSEYCDVKCKKFILSDLTVLHPLKNKPKGFFGRRKHS